MALADIIRQRKKQQSGPASAQQLAQLQQTAATGRTGMGRTGPAMSNIQAQVAAQAGQAAIGQQQAAFDTQRRGLQQQEQQQDAQFGQRQRFMEQQQQQQVAALTAQQGIADRERDTRDKMVREQLSQQESLELKQINSKYANYLADLSSERDVTTNEMFAWAEQETKQLAFDRQQAMLEHLGQVMALSDQKYVDEIRRIGQIQGLSDELAFREESVRLAFQQDLEILNQQFDMQRLMNEDEREYQRELAKMDINTALNLAAQASKEQAYMNTIQGMTSLGSNLATHYATTAPQSNSTLTGSQHAGPVQLGPTNYSAGSASPNANNPFSSSGGYYSNQQPFYNSGN